MTDTSNNHNNYTLAQWKAVESHLEKKAEQTISKERLQSLHPTRNQQKTQGKSSLGVGSTIDNRQKIKQWS